MNINVKKTLGTVSWYLIVCLLLIIFILPFIWMLSSAFKTGPQCVAYPPEFIPRPFTLRGFKEVFDISPMFVYIKNSVIITALSIVGTLLSCSLTAYGFARFRCKENNILFTILLSTMMIPSFTLIIPQFSLFSKLGWMNTRLPLVVPSFLATNAFSIFILRQFFMSFPRELDEAARLDGCSYFRIFQSILLPNSKVVLFIVALFTFVGVWNDFFAPLIYLNDMDKYTLAVGLVMLKASQGATLDLGPMMAGSLIAVIPTFILYITCQKYFVQGIVTTGLKG